MYYEPKILINVNKFNFGIQQSGIVVNNVTNPYNISAYDIIDCNRYILEDNKIAN